MTMFIVIVESEYLDNFARTYVGPFATDQQARSYIANECEGKVDIIGCSVVPLVDAYSHAHS